MNKSAIELGRYHIQRQHCRKVEAFCEGEKKGHYKFEKQKIAKYKDIVDISKGKDKHPILDVKAIFKDLVYTDYQATITEDIPRLTLKFVTILIEEQAHQTKTLEDALHTYNGIIIISLIIFTINMLIGIGRLSFELYQAYCTKEKRTVKHRRRVRVLLNDLSREIRNLGSPEEMDLNQLERRLEEVNE